MTIVVMPDEVSAPPRNEITVSTPVGSVMSEVAVYRNDHDGRSLIRSQPSAGFDSRTVFDYECPYGEVVTYDWVTSYTDPSAYTNLFAETWASLAAWTAVGAWNVSAGKLRNTDELTASLTRSFAAGKYRFVLASINAGSSPAYRVITFDTPGGLSLLMVLTDTSVTTWIQTTAGAHVTPHVVFNGSAPITLDLNAATVTISDGTTSTAFDVNMLVSRVMIYRGPGTTANTMLIGAITAKIYPAPEALAETSAPVTLDSDDAWLIAPQNPGLSFPLAHESFDRAAIESVESVEHRSNTTVHRILGASTPITVTTGQRDDDVSGIRIATVTKQERLDMVALLAPDIPILLQIPEFWGVDFDSGFYQVGDVTISRPSPVGTLQLRYHNLPLTKVQSPIVDVQNDGWSYAALAIEFVTYATAQAVFATYADMASNTRS